jgi:hypothetical protein
VTAPTDGRPSAPTTAPRCCGWPSNRPRLHGVAKSGIAFKEIAGTIGKNLGLPVTSVTPEEAPAYLNFLAMFAAADNPAPNNLARERFGWQPRGVGLTEDLNEGHYFA